MTMTMKQVRERQFSSYITIDRHSFDTTAICSFVMGEYNKYIDGCRRRGYQDGYRHGVGSAEFRRRRGEDASAPLTEEIIADRATVAGKTIAGEQGKLAALDVVPEIFPPEYREAVGVMAWTSAAIAWEDGYRDGVRLISR